MPRFHTINTFALQPLALCIAALLFGSNARADGDRSCDCRRRIGLLSQVAMTPNILYLVDGRQRYDPSTLRMWETVRQEHRRVKTEIQGRLDPFGASGTYVVVPHKELVLGARYSFSMSKVGAKPWEAGGVESFQIGNETLGNQECDKTPPTLGKLHVTGEVFTSDCGSKGLVLEDEGTHDDRYGLWRKPVLVEMVSGEQRFSTVTSTYGYTTDNTISLIGRSTFFSKCLSEFELETVPFERGESVTIHLTVLDYSGNRSATRTQTIEWPIDYDAARAQEAIEQWFVLEPEGEQSGQGELDETPGGAQTWAWPNQRESICERVDEGTAGEDGKETARAATSGCDSFGVQPAWQVVVPTCMFGALFVVAVAFRKRSDERATLHNQQARRHA